MCFSLWAQRTSLACIQVQRESTISICTTRSFRPCRPRVHQPKLGHPLAFSILESQSSIKNTRYSHVPLGWCPPLQQWESKDFGSFHNQINEETGVQRSPTHGNFALR
uniref:Uncharacterized protein n=1 Tax=Anguilla anguilla TaxID=7936 RepID=A0A0E9PQH7_ANGAN